MVFQAAADDFRIVESAAKANFPPRPHSPADSRL
jgi:hypothetical protein